MKRNKIYSLICCLTVVIMTGGLLAGCGNTPSSTSSPEPTVTQAAPVTIIVASSANWTKDVDKALADQFYKESSNKIDFQMTPDDQYTNILKAKFATGEGPDIFLTGGGTNVIQYQPEEHVLDLSNEPWVSRYTDWAKAGTTLNGKIIGFTTWSVDGWGLIYNPAIFNTAGVKVPTTYQDFLKVCEAIQSKGIIPIYEPGKAEWHQEIWLNCFTAMTNKKLPGLYEQLNQNKAKIADQKDLEIALTQMKEIADKGYFGKNFMANTWEAMIDNIGSGKYAMGLVYSTFQNEVLAKFPDSKADTWEMFPVPLADNKMWATSAGGIMRCINKDSKVIPAAKAYFNFLAKAENLKTFYDGHLDLGACSFKDVERKTTKGYQSIITNSLDGTGLDGESGIMYWDQSTIGKLVQEMYLGGKTSKQVLEGIDSFREKMFK